MSRPARILKSVYFNIGLPEDLAQRVRTHLYSPLEEKIPHGAQQEFFTNLVKEFFDALDKANQQAKAPEVE